MKNNIKHILFLGAVGIYLLSGCTWAPEPEPYREKLATDIVVNLLIDEYEVRFGDLTERCREHLHNVVYVKRGERIYPDRKFTLGRLDGEGEHFYNGVSYIWTEPTLTAMSYNVVLVHELIHGALACESDPSGTGLGDGDNDHNELDIWCTEGHGCNFDGHDATDSLEYAVAEMVRYYR